MTLEIFRLESPESDFFSHSIFHCFLSMNVLDPAHNPRLYAITDT